MPSASSFSISSMTRFIFRTVSSSGWSVVMSSARVVRDKVDTARALEGLPAIAQVASALDLVVHQARRPDGSRIVESVSEVVRAVGGVATRELYRCGDRLRPPADGVLAARLGGMRGRGRDPARSRTPRHPPPHPSGAELVEPKDDGREVELAEAAEDPRLPPELPDLGPGNRGDPV